MVAAAVVARLRRLGHRSPVLEQRLAQLEAFDRPADGIGADNAAAHAVFLLGLPAQHLDQDPRGQPRHGRHRLPRHGAVDARTAAPRPSRIWAREGVDLDRAGAVHQRTARLPESRRRHLHPFRPAGDPRRGGSRRQHHLQDPLQRRGRDDRRPAGRGRPDGVADRASGLGRRRQAPRHRLRRSREISQQLLPVRRDRSSSPRTRRGAARAARGQGPHRPDLRPDLRRRKAPPPQARALSRSAQARLHQRARLRRLRRLLAGLELRLGAAAGDRVRPQAADRPVELQQGLFLHRGLLPEFRHRAWRQAAARPTARRPIRRRCSPICRCRRRPRSTAPTTSSSPASAAPASSPSARCSAWPPMSTAGPARRSTSPACRRRTARS